MTLAVSYAEQIFAGISPLFTIDHDHKLRFVNRPFEEEFTVESKHIIGKSLFDVLSLSFADRETMLDAFERRNNKRTANQQFRYGRRYYGYTVFPAGKDQGIILKNITDIRRLERKVQELHSRLLRAQEEERQRLGAELHDGVGQTIIAAKINLMAFNNDRIKNNERFDIAVQFIDRASDELREIYSNLYPSVLRELGLASAIRDLLRALEAASIHVEAEIDITAPLPEDLEVQVYRLFQELAANTLKHSTATRVSAAIYNKKELVYLQFDDDGKGFDLHKNRERGFGLQNIRRRIADWQGWMQLVSFKGGGTSIQIRLPIKKKSSL